jgi:hypothetical protein
MDEREQGLNLTEHALEHELAEVYLLLDYLSGRSDKRLTAALGKDENEGEQLLKKICQIGLPSKGTADERAMLIATKDRLNVAAKPANGNSIAFTLLVTASQIFAGSLAEEVKTLVASGKPQSRVLLAEIAYPGLRSKADHFRRRIIQICWALLFWLVCTCFLSWNVAGGQASLARLNAVETERTAVAKRFADAEPAQIKGFGVSNLAAAGNAQESCKRLLTPNVAAPVDSKQADNKQADSKQPDFDANQRQLCQELKELDNNYSHAREQLGLWLAVWRWPFYWHESKNDILEQQWNTVFLEVLATSVLPIFYGLLGAGVAVVRNIWSKLRDSLLSPRDLYLSLGQLAQGAVIGACIGLFFPSGSQGAGGATPAISLAPSALSFIAGFGVEGVFVMVEGLIKRVFNIAESKP